VAEDRPPVVLTLPARLEQIRRISEALAKAAGEAGLSPGELIDLDLAVVEAANNIVLHGYEGDGGQSVEVAIQIKAKGLTVILTDSGRPIPGQRLNSSSPAPLDAECGRGFGIIHACVNSLSYQSESGVNRLTLVKNRSGPAAGP
jgi:serine/threonine-protein kinase RsbW